MKFDKETARPLIKAGDNAEFMGECLKRLYNEYYYQSENNDALNKFKEMIVIRYNNITEVLKQFEIL